MNEHRKISWQGIIGSIINIIFGLGVIFISGYVIIEDINFNNLLDDIYELIPFILLILLILFGLLSIIFNSKLFSGNINKKKPAIIFGILSVSFIGVIFLKYSKEIVKVKVAKVKIIEEKINYNQIITSLLKYKSLLDNKVITEEEFKLIKSKILNL